MIFIDDTEPEGALEPSFPSRNVVIQRGIDAKELYELITEIGRGKFGTVYKCREKTTGLNLAAKFVPIPKREDRRNVEHEVEIMNSLQHHLIIQLYAAYEYQKMMCVVLELVEGGELFDRVIDDDFVLTEKVCTIFMRQVCEAMQFIHRNNILHLDMKPENILCLTREGNRIKIIDFGLARKYDPNKKLQVLFGTPEFVAPEVVNFDNISYGTDMWSIGVICYVLLSGISPFMGETDIETMANVTIAKYDFDDEAFNNVTPEALDFITKLLVKDISERMSASECLEHEWLRKRPKPTPISPPPFIIPPKYIRTPPSPPPDEIEMKELETTKDNLRAFIERWEEHPNSPYVFDTEANLIVPLRERRADSLASSKACSPSPRGSICSLNEEFDDFKDMSPEFEKFQDEDRDKHISPLVNRNFKEYLHSFDRRNSDTNYILGRRPSGEKINLAEEIRKLSDHLLMLAEINTKLGKETDNAIKSNSSSSISSRKNFVEKTKDKHTIKEEINEINMHNFTEEEIQFKTAVAQASGIRRSSSDFNKTSTKISSLTVRLQSLDETPSISPTRTNNEKTRRLSNGFKHEMSQSPEIAFGVPWPITNKRTKFRINQLSRDVPIGSPDTHQPFNLEDAANTTKDCLLHLLEKYNESKFKNSRGKRQSISVDWHLSDNLEQRSMSSINAFFQRHVTSGNTVKQRQAQLEAKSKH